jgi:ketosteroid isomerase-like protein
MKRLLLIALLIAGCASTAPRNAEVLMSADREFNRQSQIEGAAAWERVMAPNATKPGPNGTWIVGPAAVREQMTKALSGLTLTWEPVRAELSRGGNLGYTWGRWTRVRDGKTSHGDYMTVWEKQPDGSWKVLFDTGDVD